MATDQKTAEVIRYAQERANGDGMARAVVAMRGDMSRLIVSTLDDFCGTCLVYHAALVCVVRPGE